MYTFLIFLGGFIGGFTFLAVIRLRAEKKSTEYEAKYKQPEQDDYTKRMEWRKNTKIDNNSKTLKVIKLNLSEKAQDTYYNNDEVFITFCLGDMLPIPEEASLLLNSQNDNFQMKNINKMDKDDLIHPSILSYDFYKLLDSGKATIYSKAEGKFVDRIMRDEYGFVVGPTAGAGGYNYYLPDGTPFFEVTTWVS